MLFHPISARLFFGLVWLINGIWCKVLDHVPRHREIVARILGDEHALLLTRLIGVGEVAFAIWVFSGYLRRLSAAFQIGLVMTMNVIEFTLARDLLLFGWRNLLIAVAYCAFVAWVDLRENPNSEMT